MCRELSESFCETIDNQKLIWIRIIKKYIKNPEDQESWRKLLHRTNTGTIRELALGVCQYCRKYPWIQRRTKLTPLHFAAGMGQIEIFQTFFARRGIFLSGLSAIDIGGFHRLYSSCLT